MTPSALIISGPTATGKTTLASSIAKNFNGELVSADSRQVYQGMDIVTGKDIPDVPIHGLDLVKPDQEFDVSTYVNIAKSIIKDIQSKNKLPIIVGGTGFYIKALLNPPETLGVPLNHKFRQELEFLTISKLQQKLNNFDPQKWNQMNNSDRNNPRRLIRAIEIAAHKKHLARLKLPNHPKVKPLVTNYRHITLTCSNEKLERQIHARVLNRLNSGAIKETQYLLQNYNASIKSMSALGYQEIKQYINQQISYEQLVKLWILHELQYAKRQQTWFKKHPSDLILSIEKQNYVDIALEHVRKWQQHNTIKSYL